MKSPVTPERFEKIARELLEKKGWRFAGRHEGMPVFVHDIEGSIALDVTASSNFPIDLDDAEMIDFVRETLMEAQREKRYAE